MPKRKTRASFERNLLKVFGMWKNRKDIESGPIYVAKLRGYSQAEIEELIREEKTRGHKSMDSAEQRRSRSADISGCGKARRSRGVQRHKSNGSGSRSHAKARAKTA